MPTASARIGPLEAGPVPEPGPGEILVRNLYLSVDPAQRGWASAPAVRVGQAVGGNVDRAGHARLLLAARSSGAALIPRRHPAAR
jgi:NADPH-dependent curcumin reductase CurA